MSKSLLWLLMVYYDDLHCLGYCQNEIMNGLTKSDRFTVSKIFLTIVMRQHISLMHVSQRQCNFIWMRKLMFTRDTIWMRRAIYIEAHTHIQSALRFCMKIWSLSHLCGS